MKVTIKDLDRRFCKSLSDYISQKVLERYGKATITEEEFKRILANGFEESLIKKIRDFYEFLGEIEIVITSQDWYNMFIERFS